MSPEHWSQRVKSVIQDWVPREYCHSTCLGNLMAPEGSASTLLKPPPLSAALKVQKKLSGLFLLLLVQNTRRLQSLIQLLCFFSPLPFSTLCLPLVRIPSYSEYYCFTFI